MILVNLRIPIKVDGENWVHRAVFWNPHMYPPNYSLYDSSKVKKKTPNKSKTLIQDLKLKEVNKLKKKHVQELKKWFSG